MALRRLFLHTGTSLIRIEAGKEPTLQMHICGSIIRPLVYTNTYNDEHVLSVELLSNSKIVGTVNYDRAAGTCRGVAEIDWKAYSNTKVTLAEPYVLDGVASADAAKGLYLPVAAGNYEGWQYVVRTDRNEYTFVGLDEPFKVKENKVVDVPLCLEDADIIGSKRVQYIGSTNDAVVSAVGGVFTVADVWAQTRESEADGWIDRPIGANPEFYTGVTFACVSESDYESENYENTLSWLSCKRKADDLPSWLLTAEPNTGEARTAYVVCLFPEDCGYTYIEPIAVKIV